MQKQKLVILSGALIPAPLKCNAKTKTGNFKWCWNEC